MITKNEVSKIAREIQSNLARIGVRSEIVVKDGVTTVTGTQRDGKTFNIRLRYAEAANLPGLPTGSRLH